MKKIIQIFKAFLIWSYCFSPIIIIAILKNNNTDGIYLETIYIMLFWLWGIVLGLLCTLLMRKKLMGQKMEDGKC